MKSSQELEAYLNGVCVSSVSKFFCYSEKGWHADYNGISNVGYFGEGTSGENGIRTLANYAFVASLMFEKKIADEAVAYDFDHILERALSSIRYLVRTHKTGDLKCVDGKQWGGHWQSSWWATKLVFASRLLDDYLQDNGRNIVDVVLEYEANRHLPRTVPSGLNIDTKAEENGWDNEILSCAVSFLPNHENHELWTNKLTEFAFNTLSVPQDHFSDEVRGGKQVKDHVYTVNLHSDYTIENHGSLHFCYIASPLLSISWSIYAFLSQGKAVPAELLHNVSHLWRVAKPMFLGDRFAYLGGKDWARYTYGLYFIVPVLYMVRHFLQDEDAEDILKLRLNRLIGEQNDNSDGAFYGDRVTRSVMRAQPAKYETDCFACIGLTYLYSLVDLPSVENKDHFSSTGVLVSQESQVAYAKSEKLFASFSWSTLVENKPIGLFVPVGDDDLTEWAECNLLGNIKVLGFSAPVGVRSMVQTANGFKVEGVIGYRGKSGEYFKRIIKYQVDLNTEMLLVESKIIATSDAFCLFSEGLSFAVVNDKFNGFTRKYYFEGGDIVLEFDPRAPLKFYEKGKLAKIAKVKGWGNKNEIVCSNWLNIDNKIGVIALDDNNNDCFTINSPAQRNTEAKCIHYDRVCRPQRRTFYRLTPGEVVFDTRTLLILGDKEKTRAVYEKISSGCAVESFFE